MRDFVITTRTITKAMIALVMLAAVFALGLYFGSARMGGAFTVTTQYEIGAVGAAELAELAEAQNERQRPDVQDVDVPAPPQTVSVPDAPPVNPHIIDGKININTADIQTLTTLPGVGPVLAERIIEHRQAHGPFRLIEEITDVSGIGTARFADMQGLITIGD